MQWQAQMVISIDCSIYDQECTVIGLIQAYICHISVNYVLQ